MIKEAIIPLAGLGTRMLPLSKSIPKELLPLGKISILEHILNECTSAGIKKIILVISKKKDLIKNYFQKDYLLEKKVNKNKNLLQSLRNINSLNSKIKFVYQNSPKGLGDAVLKCKSVIKSKYFLLVLPDDIVINSNCSSELVKLNYKTKSSIIALRKVPKNQLNRYGIVKINKKNQISKMIEKPKINEAPSKFAIIGRYILNKNIFNFLSKTKKGKLGEVQITDSLNKMIANEDFYGCKFKGKYLDCGTIEGYIKSFKTINS